MIKSVSFGNLNAYSLKPQNNTSPSQDSTPEKGDENNNKKLALGATAFVGVAAAIAAMVLHKKPPKIETAPPAAANSAAGQTLRNAGENIVNKAKEEAANLVNKINDATGGKAGEVVNTVVEGARDLGSKAMNKINDATGGKAGEVVNTVTAGAKETAAQVGEQARKVVQDLKDPQTRKAIVDNVRETTANLGNKLQETGSSLLENVKKTEHFVNKKGAEITRNTFANGYYTHSAIVNGATKVHYFNSKGEKITKTQFFKECASNVLDAAKHLITQ